MSISICHISVTNLSQSESQSRVSHTTKEVINISMWLQVTVGKPSLKQFQINLVGTIAIEFLN